MMGTVTDFILSVKQNNVLGEHWENNDEGFQDDICNKPRKGWVQIRTGEQKVTEGRRSEKLRWALNCIEGNIKDFKKQLKLS